jgi:uncharacterized protein (TIGR02246 family)
MKRRLFSTVLLTATWSLFLLTADDPKEQAIRKFFADADLAWNAHDAHQLVNSKTVALDADFVNAFGGWVHGQANFVSIMEGLQAGPFRNVTRRTVVDQIRFLGSDVAIVIVTSHDQRPGEPAHEIRGTFVLNKQENRWLIISMQNTDVQVPPK